MLSIFKRYAWRTDSYIKFWIVCSSSMKPFSNGFESKRFKYSIPRPWLGSLGVKYGIQSHYIFGNNKIGFHLEFPSCTRLSIYTNPTRKKHAIIIITQMVALETSLIWIMTYCNVGFSFSFSRFSLVSLRYWAVLCGELNVLSGYLRLKRR